MTSSLFFESFWCCFCFFFFILISFKEISKHRVHSLCLSTQSLYYNTATYNHTFHLHVLRFIVVNIIIIIFIAMTRTYFQEFAYISKYNIIQCQKKKKVNNKILFIFQAVQCVIFKLNVLRFINSNMYWEEKRDE